MRVYPHTVHQEEHGLAGIDLETFVAVEFAKAEVMSGDYRGPCRPIARAIEFVEKLKE